MSTAYGCDVNVPRCCFVYRTPAAAARAGSDMTAVTSLGMNQNMAAAMELRCWGGDWGLPSVHTDSLIVLVKNKNNKTTLFARC